ncbi:PAS domain-containing protein [Methanolobus mangrovi]|uniref:histidine kinase n=1 Tax=Methanolobus mangrovi TaxID=3072977 RepID=A0AA51UHU2_9EURY|nr:PAS domain-containing protein [Methanolobus mangrovi]WMW21956.1 PAS domain-containing protein [Methanolobus mangrovi]
MILSSKTGGVTISQNTGFGKFGNNNRKEDSLKEDSNQDTVKCDGELIDVQKKMELRIRALEGLVNNTRVIAFLRSPKEDAPVEFISEGIESFGYKVEDLTSGKITFKDLIHPDDFDRVYLELTENALEGASDFRQTYRIRTKKGYVRVVEERTAIMRDENGKVIYYQGVLEDITDKK